MPKSSTQAEAAKKFIEWATSKDYIKMIGENDGWVTVPPGTRKSTYANPAYQKAAPFAKGHARRDQTAACLNTDEGQALRRNHVATIPEMQAIGNFAGQQVAAALTGKITVDAALDAAAANADRTLQQAGGYQK